MSVIHKEELRDADSLKEVGDAQNTQNGDWQSKQ
jgi:hypothetical protein